MSKSISMPKDDFTKEPFYKCAWKFCNILLSLPGKEYCSEHARMLEQEDHKMNARDAARCLEGYVPTTEFERRVVNFARYYREMVDAE